MVSKRCVICGGYFQGDWNGVYACRACQQAGVVPSRPLSSLDSLAALATAASAVFEPQPDPPKANAKAKGRAA